MEQAETDRRKKQRRRENSEEINNLYLNRRGPDRRKQVRRECPRVIYPLRIAPQILNMRAQVVGISAKSVRFFFSDFDPQMENLKKQSKIRIEIRFHDGFVAKKNGVIIRKDKYQEDKDHFVCLFDKELPAERIEKEQTHLLKKLLTICTEKMWDSPPMLFFD